jgi:hypothetical protein
MDYPAVQPAFERAFHGEFSIYKKKTVFASAGEASQVDCDLAQEKLRGHARAEI